MFARPLTAIVISCACVAALPARVQDDNPKGKPVSSPACCDCCASRATKSDSLGDVVSLLAGLETRIKAIEAENRSLKAALAKSNVQLRRLETKHDELASKADLEVVRNRAENTQAALDTLKDDVIVAGGKFATDIDLVKTVLKPYTEVAPDGQARLSWKNVASDPEAQKAFGSLLTPPVLPTGTLRVNNLTGDRLDLFVNGRPRRIVPGRNEVDVMVGELSYHLSYEKPRYAAIKEPGGSFDVKITLAGVISP